MSDSNPLDADDVRLLRAIRDCPYEWAARPDIQQSPIDELRLYEMARYGYVKHIGERFLWNGPANYVELNPHVLPAHIFRIHRKHRTERDFEYFM